MYPGYDFTDESRRALADSGVIVAFTIVSIQREWRMWSDALLRMHVSRGDRRLEVARHRLDLIADNDCWRTFPAPLVRSDRVDYLRRLAVMVTTRRVSPGASCCL